MTDIAAMELSDEQLARSQGRLDRLRQLLADEGHSAMIIDHEIDIWYLTGFVGHDATLVVGPDIAAILCDARYEEYLMPWKNGGVHQVHIGPRQELVRRIRTVAQ
jgi:Xaa-Pro aminopeptidase